MKYYKTLEEAIDFSVEKLSNLLSAVNEGGIAYWASWSYDRSKYNEAKSKLNNPCYEEVLAQMIIDGSPLIINDFEEDKQYELTAENLRKGIQMWWLNFKTTEESYCDVDAIGADIIIQFSLFEDIIYG